MDQGETGYHQWTAEELVRETVSNFESLEGVDSVEWAVNDEALIHLIRVTRRDGGVLRLAFDYWEDDEGGAFDEAFYSGGA